MKSLVVIAFAGWLFGCGGDDGDGGNSPSAGRSGAGVAGASGHPMEPDDDDDQKTLLTGVVSLATESHGCAVMEDTSVTCWPNGSLAGIGNEVLGVDEPADGAITVPGIRGAIAVAVERPHSCVLLDDGTIWCWGSNAGQVGFPSNRDGGPEDLPPTRLPGIADAIAFDVSSTDGCAVIQDGSVRCWGTSPRIVGAGNGGSDLFEPQTVVGVTDAVSVATSIGSACAVRKNGRVVCWGLTRLRNLFGDGAALPEHPHLFEPPGLEGVEQLKLDGIFCARVRGGTVRCWGSTERAILGGGSAAGTGELPNFTDVAGVDSARDIAVGSGGGCVVLADKTARCWRRLQTSNEIVGPEDTGFTGVVAIAARSTDYCALFEDTSVRCWRGAGPSSQKQIYRQ